MLAATAEADGTLAPPPARGNAAARGAAFALEALVCAALPDAEADALADAERFMGSSCTPEAANAVGVGAVIVLHTFSVRVDRFRAAFGR